ncbi:protein JINGUBANG [Corylus avellana]|uniref:protein JINGUBANG n=1 Tax=Corylus avellana TaxID=13451 RepID=UPI001E1F8F7D|nr:protein JINGUBANG [Corylus avellana]
MGLQLPCPLPCLADNESESHSNHLIHSESSTSSLSSQPSLPSVPSLSTSTQQPTTTAHHLCIATVKGNSSYVSSLAVAGKFLYTGSSNSEIRSWSRDNISSTDNVVPVVAVSNGVVKSLVVFEDKLFSAHQDNKIRVWKIDDDNPQQKYKFIAALPTLNDRFSRLFSAKNYVEVRRHKKCTWVHHVDNVSALAISRDGSLLYSASWDRTFKIWRTSDFKCLESVGNAHDDAINAIVLSEDGFVYTGSADKKIKVWIKEKAAGGEKKKHSAVATLEKHKSAVNALALSGDGCVLYSGACDRSILVWERDGDGDGGGVHMVLVGALRGHSKAILCLAVVEDLVCSGSADKTVRIWRRGMGKSYSCLGVLEGHRRPVKCLAAAVDGNSIEDPSGSDSCTCFLVYSGSLDCDIKVWRVWVPFLY